MLPCFTAVALTLFPEMFPGPLGYSLTGKALEKGLWHLKTLDFRRFAGNKHGTVDDTPFGGGPGLVMRPDIAAAAIDQAKLDLQQDGFTADHLEATPIVYLSPRGKPFEQADAWALAKSPGVILVCGRFEGVDDRVMAARNVQEFSLGDMVLTGGELPAMAMLDATLRLMDGVIGSRESLVEESFSAGLLEHPHYTRPSLWEGHSVPPVLLSGDHKRIAAWRQAEAERITQERRPDLWQAYVTKQGFAVTGEAAKDRSEDDT